MVEITGIVNKMLPCRNPCRKGRNSANGEAHIGDSGTARPKGVSHGYHYRNVSRRPSRRIRPCRQRRAPRYRCPVGNGGKGEGFSPTDLCATALAGCAMAIIGIYGKMHDVDVTGDTTEATKP